MGDDGRCVLCRRKSGEMPEEPRSPWPTIGLVTAFFVIGLGAYALISERDKPTVGPDPLVQRPLAPARTDAAEAARRPAAAPAPKAPNILERREAWRQEKAEKEEAIAYEMTRVPITMYTTATCVHCKAAREWLAENKYRYDERNVEEDTRYDEQLEQLNPRKSVPTLQIGETVVVGFNASSVERALRGEAEKFLAAR